MTNDSICFPVCQFACDIAWNSLQVVMDEGMGYGETHVTPSRQSLLGFALQRRGMITEEGD